MKKKTHDLFTLYGLLALGSLHLRYSSAAKTAQYESHAAKLK